MQKFWRLIKAVNRFFLKDFLVPVLINLISAILLYKLGLVI